MAKSLMDCNLAMKINGGMVSDHSDYRIANLFCFLSNEIKSHVIPTCWCRSNTYIVHILVDLSDLHLGRIIFCVHCLSC